MVSLQLSEDDRLDSHSMQQTRFLLSLVLVQSVKNICGFQWPSFACLHFLCNCVLIYVF